MAKPDDAPPSARTLVQAIRQRAKLSQSEFARELNVSTKLVQAWEGGRRQPRGAALKLLRIATHHPEVVFEHPDIRRARAHGIDIELLREAAREARSGDPWARVLAMADAVNLLETARAKLSRAATTAGESPAPP